MGWAFGREQLKGYHVKAPELDDPVGQSSENFVQRLNFDQGALVKRIDGRVRAEKRKHLAAEKAVKRLGVNIERSGSNQPAAVVHKQHTNTARFGEMSSPSSIPTPSLIDMSLGRAFPKVLPLIGGHRLKSVVNGHFQRHRSGLVCCVSAAHTTSANYGQIWQELIPKILIQTLRIL